MRRYLCWMIALLLAVGTISIPTVAEGQDSPSTVYGRKMDRFLNGNDFSYLHNDEDFNYMVLGSQYQSDGFLNTLFMKAGLGTVNLFSDPIGFLKDKGTKPDEDMYIDLLTTLMVLYDKDNAGEVSTQEELKIKQGLFGGFEGLMSIATDAYAVLSAMPGITSDVANFFSIGMNLGSGTVDSLSETQERTRLLANAKALGQGYSEAFEFLQAQQRSDVAALNQAASTLAKGMEDYIPIRLFDAQKGFETADVLAFDVYPVIVEGNGAIASRALMALARTGGNVLAKFATLVSSFSLGTALGTIGGNFLVGGTTLVDRAKELMALKEISDRLKNEVHQLQSDYYMNRGTEAEEESVRRLVAAELYLTVTRMRGEYCVYSIVAEDAGLLGKVRRGSAKDAATWYAGVSEKLERVRDILRNITRPEFDDTGEVIVADGALYFWKYTTDSFADDGPQGTVFFSDEAVNQLVCLRDGEETVVTESDWPHPNGLPSAGNGRIAPGNGRVFFRRDFGYMGQTVCSVDVETGEVTEHLEGELLGLATGGKYLVVDPIVYDRIDPYYGTLVLIDTDTLETDTIVTGGHDFATVREGVVYYAVNDTGILDMYSVIPGLETPVSLFSLNTGGMVFDGVSTDPIVAQMAFAVVNDEPWVYASCGYIDPYDGAWQGGWIVRAMANGHYFEILAEGDALATADFIVSEDGEIDCDGPMLHGRRHSTDRSRSDRPHPDYTFYTQDGTAFVLDPYTGNGIPVLEPEDYAEMGGDALVAYAAIIEDTAYVRVNLGDGGGVHGGALFARNMTTGEVQILYTY